MVSLHHSYHRKCIDFDDHQCYFLKMLASYSSHSYLIIGMDSSQNFPRAGSKFGIFWIGGCGEMIFGVQLARLVSLPLVLLRTH